MLVYDKDYTKDAYICIMANLDIFTPKMCFEKYCHMINIQSNICALFLLYLEKLLQKNEKMHGLPRILSLPKLV